MKRMMFGTALWAFAFVVLAAAPEAVRKQVERSMLVAGTVDIQPDGSVSGHALDPTPVLPAGVVRLVGEAVSQWRFEPVLVDGKPVNARAKMNLRIVAKAQDDGDYNLSVRSASFGSEGGVPGEFITSARISPPRYPEQAARSGMSGAVYLVLRIGRDGRVEEVVAEQVNLTAIGTETQMTRARDLLSRAALKSAKYWTFHPPTGGEDADAPFWSARVPVDFILPGQSKTSNGQWQAYVPGPQQQAAWIRDDADAGSPDAFVAGGVHQVGKGPRLLTPLDRG